MITKEKLDEIKKRRYEDVRLILYVQAEKWRDTIQEGEFELIGRAENYNLYWYSKKWNVEARSILPIQYGIFIDITYPR